MQRSPAVGRDALDEGGITCDLRAHVFCGSDRGDFPAREPGLTPQDRVEDAILAARHEPFAATCAERCSDGGSFLVAGGGERRIVFEQPLDACKVQCPHGGEEVGGIGGSKNHGHEHVCSSLLSS